MKNKQRRSFGVSVSTLEVLMYVQKWKGCLEIILIYPLRLRGLSTTPTDNAEKQSKL